MAIKIVKKKDTQTKDLEMLKREIEVLKQCQHPNIIRFYDVFENHDYIYIVMELISGPDCFTYLSKKQFKLTEKRCNKMFH